MIKRQLIAVFSFLIFSTFVLADKKAVVCGISDYQNVSDNYCSADAKAVAKHLASLSDWNSSNVQLLTDSSATKSAVINAISNMVDNATSQDTCLFFFFGSSATSAINTWDSRITFSELSSAFGYMPYGTYGIFIDMGLPETSNLEVSLVPVQYAGSNAEGFTVVSYYEYLDDPAYQYAKNSPFAYLTLEALSGYGDANNNGTITAQECADYADPYGNYSKRVDNTSGVSITSMSMSYNDIYESDSLYSNITQITADGTPVIRAINPAGENDYITFTLYQEEYVEIETNSTEIGSDTDTIITLYDSNKTMIDSNDDNPDSGVSGYYLSKIATTLPAGTYTVGVECYYGNSSILSYSVRVSIGSIDIFAVGPDFVYEDSIAEFICLAGSYYKNMIVDADWQSSGSWGWFDSVDTFYSGQVDADTTLTVTASYEDKTDDKEVVVRNMTAPETTVEYYAVICGIADYSGTLNDLSYTVNDAVGLRNQLLKDPLWKEENITMLLDDEATYDAIRNSILAMAAASDSDDVCLFFYSGHGTTRNDSYPYDETDGEDECLVAYNTNISDDDFGNWINQLPTDNYIVLIDSCFSGGMIKSSDTSYSVKGIGKSLTLKGDGFADDIYKSVISTKDLDDNGRGIVLTASDYDELSWESAAFAHGTFTYYLLEALKGAGDTDGDGFVSAEECYQYVYPLALASDEQTTQVYDPGRLEMPVMQYNSNSYIKSLSISGQADITLDSQTSFTCNAVFSDGSQSDITDKVKWSADSSYAVVSTDGVVTTGSDGVGTQFNLNAVYNNIFSVSILLSIGSGKYSGGIGTVESPYVIEVAGDLVALSETPDDWDSFFFLSNHIDMSGTAMSPIGTSANEPFNGKFDGNGKEIRNLNIMTNGGDYAGLFGAIGSGAVVQNLGLYNIDVDSSGGNFAGSFSGWCFGTISGCFATGSVSGASQVGGIAGGLSGPAAVIEDCYSLCDVNASVVGGGLVGIVADSAVINRCLVSGDIKGEGDLAPFVYYDYSSNISNCFYDASVDLTGSGVAWALNNDQLKSSDVYIAAGWDFSAQGMWKIKDGYSPMLSWQEDFLPGDFNESGAVDTDDLMLFAVNWLAGGVGNSCDISKYGGDGIVDLEDLTILSLYYSQE
ncbi:MAG: caspase family protein [Sedimentisphaeraceae bacterium JB056]